MSRSRNPEDPDRWPDSCARCGRHCQTAAKWPDGRVCGPCYQQAKRTEGTCECGHVGILPGIVEGKPSCRRCSGVHLNIDCRRCGAEAELYTGSICWRCRLADLVDESLSDPTTRTIRPQLEPVARALKNMKRENSGVTWIRQKHVATTLAKLRSLEAITHRDLDALPPSKSREYLRFLLVEHGALPPRDEYLERFKQWAEAAVLRVPAGHHRDVLARFIRWDRLRRMRAASEVSRGTFLTAKQSVTVAAQFLNWLDAERSRRVEDLTQEDIDEWISGGTTTRFTVDRFLLWAKRARVVSRDLEVYRHRRGGARRLESGLQLTALRQAVDGETLTPDLRAAAILILVFGQRIRDVAALRWSSVEVLPDVVRVTLGRLPIDVPPPLDQPFRDLDADSRIHNTAAHPTRRWVLRGYRPGQHIYPGHLANRLAPLVGARPGRLGALEEIVRTLPVPIAAEALGYATTTIAAFAERAAVPYARYMSTRLDPTRRN